MPVNDNLICVLGLFSVAWCKECMPGPCCFSELKDT